MKPVLVDSNVILDVTQRDSRWAEWSAEAIESAGDSATLVINPVIYAEVSIGYDRIEDVDAALPRTWYRRDPVPFEAGFLAGKAFLAYQRRGGRKWTPIPDFYIGAHAAIAGFRLLTRDPRRYRTYFPTVELICP
jgi:predicted nucleic acid-binding protein